MTTKIPIFEAKIIGTDNTGIFAMSFVDVPANESNFVALNKANKVKLSLDKSKQLLTGVVLIPDQMIYRLDETMGEYYLRFTAADIEKIAQKMMKTGIALATTTHQHEKPLRGNYLAELWIVEDPKRDKAVALGLGELPKGTLVASYKIEDSSYWRTQVMTGKVKGFSLEGIFNFKSVKMNKTILTPKKAATVLDKKKPANGVGIPAFLRTVAALLEGETVAATDDLADEAKKDEVDAGDPYLIFELADGSEVYVDSEGFCTLDEEQAPAGEHALADGNFIVIDDSGMLVVTAPEADAVEPEAAAAALKKQKEAKLRAKQYLAAAGDPKETKIAALKKQIAELEKQPSTTKAKPAVDGADKKPVSEMTYTEKMAKIITDRRERQDNKKRK